MLPVKFTRIALLTILLQLITPGSVLLYAQTTLPDTPFMTLDGEEVVLSELADGTRPVVVVFWATWCKPCIEELEIITAYHDVWQEEAGFNLVTVCTDDARTAASAKSFISGKGWSFKVIPDSNQHLMRAMNVTDIPFYYIFDPSGELKVRHTGYAPGDEEYMFEEIKSLSNDIQE